MWNPEGLYGPWSPDFLYSEGIGTTDPAEQTEEEIDDSDDLPCSREASERLFAALDIKIAAAKAKAQLIYHP